VVGVSRLPVPGDATPLDRSRASLALGPDAAVDDRWLGPGLWIPHAPGDLACKRPEPEDDDPLADPEPDPPEDDIDDDYEKKE
jgi:hypothetical protein